MALSLLANSRVCTHLKAASGALESQRSLTVPVRIRSRVIRAPERQSLAQRWYSKKPPSKGPLDNPEAAQGEEESQVAEKTLEEAEKVEETQKEEVAEAEDATIENSAQAASKKHRVTVKARQRSRTSGAIGEGSANKSSDPYEGLAPLYLAQMVHLYDRLMATIFGHYYDPVPSKALAIVVPNFSTLLERSVTRIPFESLTLEHAQLLTSLAQAQRPVALIYANPVQTSTTQAYFGRLCYVGVITKNPATSRYEVGVVMQKIFKLKGDVLPNSLTEVNIEDWPYMPTDQVDIEHLHEAALQLQSAAVATDRRDRLVVPDQYRLAHLDIILRRISLALIEKVGRHDPAGVRMIVERSFAEPNLHLKLAELNKAWAMIHITHDLTHSIDEMQEKRKLIGLEQQMEKMLKQQLQDPAHDPDLKLARQIAALPEHLRATAQKEFDYMKSLEPSGSEHGVVSNYLDWLVNMPWNTRTVDTFDMKGVQEKLDKSHHGLDDVKLKILQLMANGSRTGKISSKPILFVGPPGTGKTSFAKAIAESLGRKFIGLAGLTETNDLRGHRRTYVGSIPGKIASEMRRCGSKNPVIVLDEVDKIDDSQKHKPLTPALLELLSPDQNKAFYDQYLDTTIDCSEVLFICTANSLETISEPLLNRLHVIELRAYSSAEKFDIAKNYVLPQILEDSGLRKVTMTDEAIRHLIKVYSKYEAGVRQIRRHMLRIMRQLAVKAVASVEGTNKDPKEYECVVTSELLSSGLLEAPDSPTGDRIYENPPPAGIVNGLAKNMYGGSTLTIEAIADVQRGLHGKPGVEFTGGIMDTMKESSDIAYTYAKSFLAKYFPDNKFFQTSSLHVHVPFAMVKKDGPSAGCALVCAYLSVALGIPLAGTLCMTGEITLTGRVTAVGGIREKVTAAVTNGMTKVLIPMQNKADYEAIPRSLVENITPHYVSTYEEAFKHAFGIELPGFETPKSHNLVKRKASSVNRKIIINNTNDTPVEPPTKIPTLKVPSNRPGRQPKIPEIPSEPEDKRSKIPTHVQ